MLCIVANNIALVATRIILEKYLTEENVGDCTDFCRQKDNRIYEQALPKKNWRLVCTNRHVCHQLRIKQCC